MSFPIYYYKLPECLAPKYNRDMQNQNRTLIVNPVEIAERFQMSNKKVWDMSWKL